MKQLSLLIIMILFSLGIYSQDKKANVEMAPPPPPPVEELMDKYVVPEEAPPPVLESVDYDRAEVAVVEEYGHRNPKYKYEDIGYRSGVSFFYDPYKTNNDYYGGYKYGVIKNGKIVLPAIFRKGYYNNTDNKTVQLSIENNHGIFNYETEQWEIPLIYTKIDHVKDNIFIASLSGKYGIIDDKNNILADFQWFRMDRSYGGENYFTVKENEREGSYGIYNLLTKKLILPCTYKSVQQKGNSGFFVTRDDNLSNIVDFTNKPIFKNWYESMAFSDARPNIIVKKDGLFGVIDMNENIVVPFEYTEWRSYPFNDGSYLAKNKKGKYGCILLDGRITLPFEYDNLKETGYNNLLSSRGDKCGIVQVGQGLPTEIVTCDYDDIKFLNNNFVYKKAGKYGLLDRFGKITIAPEYTKLESLNNGYDSKQLFIGESTKGYSIFNNEGRQLNASPYKEITPIFQKSSGGYNERLLYLKQMNSANKVGLLDLTGVEVVPPTYDDIIDAKDNKFVYKLNNKYGLYAVISRKNLAQGFDSIIDAKDNWIGIKGNDYYQLDAVNGTNHKKLEF